MVEHITFDDTVQEIKRFLGYCRFVKRIESPTFSCFLNLEHYKDYIDWLMQTRGWLCVCSLTPSVFNLFSLEKD